MSEKTFTVSMKLLENYLFEVDFGEFGSIMTDEPEPLGNSEGPNPARMLGAAVANCLAASLMFAVRKFNEDPGEVKASVTGTIARIDGRWRVSNFSVDIQLGNAAASLPHLQRALDQFEDFCIVTQSVRNGIEVDVRVHDADGTLVLGEDA